NIANAASKDQRTGGAKDFRRFSKIVSMNDEKSTFRNLIPDSIKSKLNLSDEEYASLYGEIAKKHYLEQIRDCEQFLAGKKIIKGSDLKRAIKEADDELLQGIQNEVNIYNSKINAFVACVNSIDEIPDEYLEFAYSKNLPIYLLGEQHPQF
ncbi:hypothetical protein IJ531_05430, partial [bacterium]|nr:hypothetical protein [bacterium]